MNVNFDIVNRALTRLGEEAITEKDKEEQTLKWKLCKGFYLQTILESLATTPWTSSQKHAILEKIEDDNYTEYQYAYKLPLDCAKPIQLKNNEYYIVIGDVLYTDQEDAILRYVSNFKKIEQEKLPEEDNIESLNDEIIDDEINPELPGEENPELPGEENPELPGEENPELPGEENPELPGEENPEEDYPDYNEIVGDVRFWEYIELRLASKLALKFSGEMSLYSTLFNEAKVIEQEAITASKNLGFAKKNGNDWWLKDVNN